jgi:hypothetical protein
MEIIKKLQRNQLYPIGNGWTKKTQPFRYFMVHTTNGNQWSNFMNEVNFLLRNKSKNKYGAWTSVSAHYLISKDGIIYELLDPDKYVAIHTGLTLAGRSNKYSLGVEMHYTPGEGRFPAKTWYALTWLKNQHPNLIPVTHRESALPKGRKIDPSGISDSQFNYWKTHLHVPVKLITVMQTGNIRKQPSIKSAIIETLKKPEQFMVYGDPETSTLDGGTVGNNKKWYYLNGVGYVHESITQ